MSDKQLKNVDFGFIRYANCWEDADILLEGLACSTNQKIISIASGGCNSFSLLTTDPEVVVAVDISLVQLYLVELKRLAIRKLSREEYLKFVGFRSTDQRTATYHLLRNDLSSPTRRYWDYHEKAINDGIVNIGKFERYLKSFCKWLLPLVHTRGTRRRLIAPKSDQDQELFYQKEWNIWTYRALFKIFFSRAVMGRFGRDPEFFNQVGINVGQFIHHKTGEHLKTSQCQENHILHYALMGYFGEVLPHYARKENYYKIQKNIDRFEIHVGLLESAFQEYGTFDRFNLSNIFEYMDIPTFDLVGKQVVQNANPQARFAYWCLMVPRYLKEVANVNQLTELSDKLSKVDKGFFYREFVVSEK